MTRFIFIVAFLFLWNFANISANPPSNVSGHELKKDNVSYRLPNNTRPETNDIEIVTEIARGNFEFSGTVRIGIRVIELTKNITLHQRQLKVRSIKLETESGHSISTLPPEYQPMTEFFTITTDGDVIQPGNKVFLTIDYKGTLREDFAGFYRSSYTNSDGKRVWLATTQFESTNARHAFPCFDEPALKATFDIRIVHSPKYSAISNMPEIDRKETMSGNVVTVFKTTPPISTYLIAFIVSDFEYKERWSQTGLRHRVLAQSNKINHTIFTLYEGEKLLNAISDYLQVNYSLLKIDQAAIPDFDADGMEHWGLITYSEEILLYNETIHSNRLKKNTVLLISHEFSHQWFGDLVSPKWWSYLWLKEGFATLFEYIGTDLIHPHWNIFHDFVVSRLHVALIEDETNKSRPMTYYMESPKDIEELFVGIAYEKSVSVLRMFLHAFTEASFKKGLNYYLKKRSFDSAVDVDLFESLERAVKEDNNLATNFNVRDIFNSWSDQAGFPLLVIERNYVKNSIKISQERYFNEHPYPETSESTWWVPYNFDTSNNFASNDTSMDGWLSQGTRSAIIKPSGNKTWSETDWVLFNKQQTGYYRVLYDRKNYNLILKELNSGDLGKIHPLSRAQLFDDIDAFVQSGRLPYDIYFDFVRYLRRETEFAPWAVAEKSLLKIKRSLAEGSDEFEKFRQFVVSVVGPIYTADTFNYNSEEPLLHGFKRNTVIKLACEFGVESCVEKTKELLEESLTNENFTFFSPNSRSSIYYCGIRSINSNLTEILWDRLISTKNIEERQEIINSFGNIADKTLLTNYLHRAIDLGNSLPPLDRKSLFISIAMRSQFGLTTAISLLRNSKRPNEDYNYLDLNRTLPLLARNIDTNEAKNRFVPIITTLARENLMRESEAKTINEIMEEAMRVSKSSRKIIEDSVFAL